MAVKSGSSRFHRDNAVISCPGTSNWLHVRGGGSAPALSVARHYDVARANFSVTKLMATSDERIIRFFCAPRNSPAPGKLDNTPCRQSALQRPNPLRIESGFFSCQSDISKIILKLFIELLWQRRTVKL